MSSSSRFVPISEKDIDGLRECSVPLNTRKSTTSVLNLYERWTTWKTTAYQNREPPKTLETLVKDRKLLSRTLTQFFCEIRKNDGTEYRSDSLNVFFAAMNRHLIGKEHDINLYKNPEFHGLREVVNGKIKELRRKETAPSKQASAITQDMDCLLYEQRKLGRTNPQQLLDTLMYKSA